MSAFASSSSSLAAVAASALALATGIDSKSISFSSSGSSSASTASPILNSSTTPATQVAPPFVGTGDMSTIDSTLEGRFDAAMFRGLYQRNNKRGGLKNLRCFPSCSVEHRVRGFCGRSVVVTFRSSCPLDASKEFRAFVEFEEEPFDDKRPVRIAASEVETLLRTKSKPTNPIMEGKHCFTRENVLVFEFNQERRGWHYSWGSNKHKCDTKHRLLCRLYQVEGSTLVLRARCASPEFVLFCRRRRRFTLEPSSSTAVVVTSSSAGGDSGSKRQRRTPNQAKFVQEIELLTTVHRIEAARGGGDSSISKFDLSDRAGAMRTPANNNRKSKSAAAAEDDDDDEEDEEEDEEDDVSDEDGADQDVTDATHALLALTGSAVKG